MERWEQVKNAMVQKPNMKVIVLGDAMDREDSGLEILLQIKELSDQGRVEYLPGNHDTFAYNYVRAQNMLSKPTNGQKTSKEVLTNITRRELALLEKNGGEPTLESLENFDQVVQTEIRKGNIHHNISKNELINWLGSQPIQKKVRVNGANYALAHAYFDEELYNYDKNFNLEKGLQLELAGKSHSAVLNKFRSAMWYREDDERTHYSPLAFPKGCLMIVGHTPQREVNLHNFNEDPSKQVVYVDTGNGKLQGFNISKLCFEKFENEYER